MAKLLNLWTLKPTAPDQIKSIDQGLALKQGDVRDGKRICCPRTDARIDLCFRGYGCALPGNFVLSVQALIADAISHVVLQDCCIFADGAGVDMAHDVGRGWSGGNFSPSD